MLVQRHQDRLFNFLLRRCGDTHMAEDAAQAAFIRAWENIARFDPAWRFSTWLYTIAVRLAADAERRERRMKNIDSFSLRSCSSGHDPSDGISRRDEARTVWQLADRLLGADERTALWLRYGDDASIEQIARIMGRTRSAVRVQLHRARKRLAEAWAVQERKGCAYESNLQDNAAASEAV